MSTQPRPDSRAPNHGRDVKSFALRSAAALALIVGVSSVRAADAPKPAQPAAPAEPAVVMEEMVINSVRGALISAQEIKQNSTQVVDSIVAQDIGKLPDDSVADALQRVPGVQVGRGSGEIGTVLIRGLPNIGTTLNGNEIFTGTGRGVALQDIPAELVSGIDVFKSTSPDKIEGGIAGLIDIRLRRPFDFDGQRIAGSARFVHGDTADKTSYYVSGLYSNRWKLSSGAEFGVLYAGAYQQRYFTDQTAFNYLFEPVGVPTTLVSGLSDLQLPFTQGSLITPTNRKRYANDLTLQWRSGDWEFYNEFLSTVYSDRHQVHFLIGFPRFGAFTAATVYPGTNVPITTTSTNNFHLTSMQAFRQHTNGYNNVLGAKWMHDRVTWTTELLYNWNKYVNQALIVDTRFGPTGTGTYTFSYNDDGRANLKVTGVDMASADNFYLWGLFDNRDHSSGELKGGRTDFTYKTSGSVNAFTSISGGLRWTNRDVRFRASSRNDIAPAGATNGDRFAPTVPKASSIAGFGTVSPDGTLGYYSTPRFYTASPDYLYSHANQVRALFGVQQIEPPWSPTLGFTDDESVVAGYLDGKFATTLNDMPFDGSIGLRLARTTQKLQGYRTTGTAIDSDTTNTDVLPVFNARWKTGDKTQFRFAAGRTITRANFNDLNPAVTLNAPTTTGGAAGTGSGGNPDLTSVTSDNFDLSYEYYFGKGSYVSVTPFYRAIDGYVQTFAATETIGGVNYIVTRPRNAGRGHLDGAEFTYQHFPEFKNALEGLGWQLNYTYIEGSQDVVDPTSTANPPAHTTLPYEQVSQTNYNVVLIYEKSAFSARLAYNWRGHYVDTFNGPNAPTSGLRTITAKAVGELDFSASYNINEHITITLDATNLLGRQYQDYFTDPSRYPRDTRQFDRTVGLGARFRF